MPKPRPPYLQKQITRHGRTVWYVRTDRTKPRIRIHGDFGTPEFMDAYRAAVDGQRPPPSWKLKAGSLEWLCREWAKSSNWAQASPATQRQRQNIINRILSRAETAQAPFAKITQADVRRGREARQATPAAANNYLKTMRALFSWAVEDGHMPTNPADDVKLLRLTGEGHAPWTRQDVELYRARWPIGTVPRLALEILLWTGLRRGDVARLTRQHISDGAIQIITEKNEDKQILVTIPLLRPLADLIDATPGTGAALITGSKGERITKETFGNYFAAWCKAAGVTARAHGLRKLAASMAAESGATEKELQAWFGWITNTQSRVYTAKADRARLAKQAAQKFETEELYSLTHRQVRESLENIKPEQEVTNGKTNMVGDTGLEPVTPAM